MGTQVILSRFFSRRSLLVAATIANALSLVQCGSGGNLGIPEVAPGVGNGVLLVNVQIEAVAQTSNGRMPTDFNTTVSVRVTRNNAPVTGATVVVRWTMTDTMNRPVMSAPMTLRGGGGTYILNDSPGYFKNYTVDVTSDGDSVTSIQGTGPDIWTFASPDTGARIPEGQPLTVRWYGTGAPITSVDTNNVDSTSITDTGAFTVPAMAVARRDGMDTMDKIRVRRGFEQRIMGAAPGSTFLTAVRNILNFTVVAQ